MIESNHLCEAADVAGQPVEVGRGQHQRARQQHREQHGVRNRHAVQPFVGGDMHI